MACSRCDDQAAPLAATGWCSDCERAFDAWLRDYASDIITPALAAGSIIVAVGVVLPALGIGWLIATTGVFAGFGAMVGLFRWQRRKRRLQFLATSLPRAYLPSKT